MSFMEKVFGDLNEKEVKKVGKIVDRIEALDEETSELSDEELKGRTEEFRERLDEGEELDDLLPEAFAVAREAAWRVLGMLSRKSKDSRVPLKKYMRHSENRWRIQWQECFRIRRRR